MFSVFACKKRDTLLSADDKLIDTSSCKDGYDVSYLWFSFDNIKCMHFVQNCIFSKNVAMTYFISTII